MPQIWIRQIMRPGIVPLRLGVGRLNINESQVKYGLIFGFDYPNGPFGLSFEHNSGFYSKYFEVDSRISRKMRLGSFYPVELYIDFNSIDQFQQISVGINFDFYYLTKSDRECFNY